MDGRKKKRIMVAKAIIVTLIFLLVLLALYGIYKIGSIFKIEPTKNENVPTESAYVHDTSEGNDDLETKNDDTVSYELTYLLEFSGFDVLSVPEYCGEPYAVINDNTPDFTDYDKLNPVFEKYSDLDELGRCGVATANLGLELMPTEERGAIGSIKPSGWHTIKYPELIKDRYLYNRCHLIAFSLAGENDNEKNLITGTRYMNMSGMLPFENEIANYIDHTGNHVLYRVVPCFVGQELVARGVHMEAWSVEDEGMGICINVFVYNVQPGIMIDYATGDSWVE